MHTAYETILKHRADFKVSYRFYSAEEGGRRNPPIQGYRSDFRYENIEHKPNQMFMIRPEFLDENDNLILEDNFVVPITGKALMWIVNPLMRHYHQDKIHVDLTGYFMEGSRRVAECIVVEILDLANNPIE